MKDNLVTVVTVRLRHFSLAKELWIIILSSEPDFHWHVRIHRSRIGRHLNTICTRDEIAGLLISRLVVTEAPRGTLLRHPYPVDCCYTSRIVGSGRLHQTRRVVRRRFEQAGS
jgi:hypothetical protein